MAKEIIRELELLKNFVKQKSEWNGAERREKMTHEEDERNKKEKRIEEEKTGKNKLIECKDERRRKSVIQRRSAKQKMGSEEKEKQRTEIEGREGTKHGGTEQMEKEIQRPTICGKLSEEQGKSERSIRRPPWPDNEVGSLHRYIFCFDPSRTPACEKYRSSRYRQNSWRQHEVKEKRQIKSVSWEGAKGKIEVNKKTVQRKMESFIWRPPWPEYEAGPLD